MAEGMRYPEVAKRFRQLMYDNGISAQDIVNKTGIGKASISHYVNGLFRPNSTTANKIAAAYGVSAAWLMGQEEYYNKSATSDAAEELFRNPELRALFDAARDADPEDLQAVHAMLIALKRKGKS